MRVDSGERYHRLRPHYHNNMRVTSQTRLDGVDMLNVRYTSDTSLRIENMHKRVCYIDVKHVRALCKLPQNID